MLQHEQQCPAAVAHTATDSNPALRCTCRSASSLPDSLPTNCRRWCTEATAAPRSPAHPDSRAADAGVPRLSSAGPQAGAGNASTGWILPTVTRTGLCMMVRASSSTVSDREALNSPRT